MKKLLTLLLTASLLPLGAITATAADTAPKSVIHVVTVKFKDTATPEQIQAALDGVKALPAAYPGITRVWVKSIKVQNAPGTEKKRTHAFVMEFADEAAFKAYTDSPAQKEWYKVYVPVREQSTTHDITN
ncbi:MAG: Dabb family protein [Lacunisphaera sp.]|nr:Dabb family protein [Lacunisphaera sp.]